MAKRTRTGVLNAKPRKRKTQTTPRRKGLLAATAAASEKQVRPDLLDVPATATASSSSHKPPISANDAQEAALVEEDVDTDELSSSQPSLNWFENIGKRLWAGDSPVLWDDMPENQYM